MRTPSARSRLFTVGLALLSLGLAGTVVSTTASPAEAATKTLVKREGRTVILRGGGANSSFNFGTGLFATGITDYNGKLVAGQNCEQSDPHTVSCGTNWIRVRGTLGSGNDEIGAIIPIRFTGISGGLGRDTFYGLSTADRFFGGANRARLFGYGGDDVLSGGGGSDLIRCGAGRDIAYLDRHDRVSGCEIRR